MGSSGDNSILVPPEDFVQDEELRLGRANGNIYHRKDGVDGIHDGQVMVRLKKKRFVVLDYSIVPTEVDIQAAAVDPHVTIIEGAGKNQCVTPECTKVGIPVLMYDSHPEEAPSLYLRSGLCFSCQRNLNEKRRTVRKRKGYGGRDSLGAGKKVKVNGDTIELSHDAIVIDGPVDDAKHHTEGYGYPEIGQDLQAVVREASSATNRLVAASSSGDSSSAVAFAAAVAAAGDSENVTSEEAVVSAVNAAVDASSELLQGDASTVSPDDISNLYEKAYTAMTKGIYLLSQWKASWDSNIAAAMAQETVNDAGLADAVASAVAASVEGQEGSNMIPLLLAAEQKGEASKGKESAKEVYSV